MSSTLDDINNLKVDPALRDVLIDLHERGMKRFDSVGWVRFLPSATLTFPHGLFAIPSVVVVLDASDIQGIDSAEAVSVTVVKTDTLITVTDTSTTLTRFIKVRAF